MASQSAMAYVDSSMPSTHTNILSAKQREMNIKHWPRAWKVRLIHGTNPDRKDLYGRLAGTSPATGRG